MACVCSLSVVCCFVSFLLSDIGGNLFGFCDLPNVLSTPGCELFSISKPCWEGMDSNKFVSLLMLCILLGGCNMAWMDIHKLPFPILLGSLVFPKSHTFLTYLFTPYMLRFSRFYNMTPFERHLRWFWIWILEGFFILVAGAGGLGSFSPSIATDEGKSV